MQGCLPAVLLGMGGETAAPAESETLLGQSEGAGAE